MTHKKQQNPAPAAIRAGFSGAKPITKLNSDYIKNSINPLDFYRSVLGELHKQGRRGWIDGGLCPFHTDTKPGSFRINTTTGAFKCFACGHAGRDIIAFTRLVYDLSFKDALAQLSRDWGLS
ncbi:CHC2 zinc finger domain-containing protein [Methylomicrobium sp. Wu6]|uniref:CHC2 zinc finger domain-containing protein n=1 Tax=Methylomicrobium sp. Wu6 TaxID=3107928 RepID=UPI002DD6669E|nr:CHC2 zinc finger domain-containing protein [Methylomicrobium sp. Wu6]MEC4747224.1 CHC2 zinc finger domain-containing protein [Methylomicrobium sp. Wu6]